MSESPKRAPETPALLLKVWHVWACPAPMVLGRQTVDEDACWVMMVAGDSGKAVKRSRPYLQPKIIERHPGLANLPAVAVLLGAERCKGPNECDQVREVVELARQWIEEAWSSPPGPEPAIITPSPDDG